ncbi:hypothetical protein AAWM_09210 [Aspergillus awamori]|uniref:Uncharacterized protein n=1 Tax=Aspergillus awamori TaxID=105351 RepID=A0A401L478_ASPAW|nr:hypothetical protein AAWM_09210 [Aspergillus awamori]GKZ60063.1 hypothetical protein AnigIFM49718_006397 [Aspergillus niger]GLA39091.1 hypothetical protein AnigIFM63309_006421 [Aspergillus niger]
MHMLDFRIEQLRKDTQQLSEDTDSLRAWMSELHHASDQFWQRTSSQFDSDVAEMRDRFLSTFRREFMGDQTVDNQRLINSGYIMALGGNFRVDAFLYQDDSRYVDGDGKVHQPRTDRDTFRLLYGVDPSIAENINYTPTVVVLQRHAEVKASGKREGIDVFEERFKTFLRVLESAKYAGDYLDPMREEDQLGELLSAYREFWNANKLVR